MDISWTKEAQSYTDGSNAVSAISVLKQLHTVRITFSCDCSQGKNT